MSIPEICSYLGADSLGYLSLEGLYRAVREAADAPEVRFCDACFSGRYPIGTPGDLQKRQTSLF